MSDPRPDSEREDSAFRSRKKGQTAGVQRMGRSARWNELCGWCELQDGIASKVCVGGFRV